MDNILTMVLGGGRGTRLFPLTLMRAKPAVPVAGKYRLADIPISNAINSGLRQIFVLTQFNSASLHRHINATYKFDVYGGGYVYILAAEQRYGEFDWYQGTADAVRRNLQHFDPHKFDHTVILAGDHLYRMRLEDMVQKHLDTNADLTLAVKPVRAEETSRFGIMGVDNQGRVVSFIEKPKPEALGAYLLTEEAKRAIGFDGQGDWYLASMGMYVFTKQLLYSMLETDRPDFGSDIIPLCVASKQVVPFLHHGYWEDIGTVRTFYEANLSLAWPRPPFNFYDEERPIYTRARFLPCSKVNKCEIDHMLMGDGCLIERARITRSVIGLRQRIGEGTVIEDSYLMGSDYYDLDNGRELNGPVTGIGKNCYISHAIIDKNARIGDGVTISPADKPPHLDGDGFYIRDGIALIPKDAIIPSGTVI